MLTRADVATLLEDGPHRLSELANWLRLPAVPLGITLDQLRIPACERCGRRFLRRKDAAGRWCSRSCYRGQPIDPAPPASEPPAADPPPIARRADDDEFDIVWDGVGPLPGQGETPPGLGATLSGWAFTVGKR